MKKGKLISWLFLFGVALGSCQQRAVFEKNARLQNQEWKTAEQPSFRFQIEDTASLYNIFIVVRHTEAYRYNNLWVNIHTKAPGDSIAQMQALDLQLATTEKGWLAAGMDDIYEHRIRISAAPVALKAGEYAFSLEQIMREDPLENVLNVGIRVEKELP